jgi:hypothetical protein
MAVTLWKAEYHHLAFLVEVMGSQRSISCCPSCCGIISATMDVDDTEPSASASNGERSEQKES